MKMVCNCKDFRVNMIQLDIATDVAHIHGYSLGKDFVHIRYCPWCAKPLIDADLEREAINFLIEEAPHD